MTEENKFVINLISDHSSNKTKNLFMFSILKQLIRKDFLTLDAKSVFNYLW